ncbi:uncharacterized protein [Solanum tuberosum]|uniref:uncharacterized protein n=1 Tax=Solanum tuberosum TaxID=4113 RepID=UPI00073A368C|nr:PREDICTED: uncharacterized protein LOC107062735 [Solanum tuberosum]
MCVEGTTQDTEALAVVESRICDSYYIPELKVTNYIIDSNSIEVKTSQLYKDKATLVDVMAKYKIKNNFNCKVKRSDRQRLPAEKNLMFSKLDSNSYIKMQKTEKDEFIYLFVALRPLIRGFDYCRPIVVVDGAHLGGAYKGTFVSASTLDGADRNESIMKSVRTVFPNIPHYVCIWHLWKNVCGNFKKRRNTLSDLFYSMAKAYINEDFDKLMAKVDKIDHRVNEYLEDAGEIASYTKDTLGRRFKEVLIINASKSSKMEVVPSSEFIFSVYEAGRRYIVCLERKVCSCGRFQLDEIPCAHAIGVLKEKNVKDMHPYCSDYYKPDALAKTYEIPMVAMPDKKDWSAPEDVVAETVYPPRYKRLAGRPRKRRKKNADEKITVNTNCCGQCGQEGHNRRTCTFFPKEK